MGDDRGLPTGFHGVPEWWLWRGVRHGRGGDATRNPGIGGHCHDDQDQDEDDHGFGHPPRGNPGGRDGGAQAGDRPGLVPYRPQVAAAAAIAPVNWAMM
jgi:hypothetical protein